MLNAPNSNWNKISSQTSAKSGRRRIEEKNVKNKPKHTSSEMVISVLHGALHVSVTLSRFVILLTLRNNDSCWDSSLWNDFGWLTPRSGLREAIFMVIYWLEKSKRFWIRWKYSEISVNNRTGICYRCDEIGRLKLIHLNSGRDQTWIISFVEWRCKIHSFSHREGSLWPEQRMNATKCWRQTEVEREDIHRSPVDRRHFERNSGIVLWPPPKAYGIMLNNGRISRHGYPFSCVTSWAQRIIVASHTEHAWEKR